MGFNLLSIGALAMDIIIKANTLPREDGFALVKSEQLVPGGSASNMSVAAVCCGMKAYQTGQIGDDHYGKEFLSSLIASGVNTDYLLIKENATTLHNFIISTADGRHTIFANPGNAFQTMDPASLSIEMIKDMNCLYTDMFSAKASLTLAHAAEGKIPIVYNMQCGPSMMESFSTKISEMQEMIDTASILIAGKSALCEWSGKEDPIVAAETVLDTTNLANGVICTLGADGALWHTGTRVLQAEAFDVDAIETTGAGDSFIAGFIDAFYRRNYSEEEALRSASAAGALKCRQQGSRAMFTPEELSKFKQKTSGGHITVI